MVDEHVILARLAVVEGHLRAARRHLADRAGFLASDDRQQLAAFNFMHAVQGVLDVAVHVIVDQGLGMPATARAQFEALAKAGLIDVDLANRLGAAAGGRNLIAHAYHSFDVGRFWDEAPGALDALSEASARLAGLAAPR
jgi:uncharacterized protein YutE (UPF0331/DUF86 family)